MKGCGIVLIGAATFFSQVPIVPAWAQAAIEEVTLEELQRQLAQRDALIGGLMRRLDRLAERLADFEDQLARVPAEHPPAIDPAAVPPSPPRPAPPGLGSEDDAVAGAVPRPESEAVAETSPPRAPPGMLEVDEEEIDRALERTLVQQGALLLPFGQAEFEPSFAFIRREVGVPNFFTDGDTRFPALTTVRRSEYRLNLALRLGLPLDSQVSFGMPFRHVNQSTVTTVGSNVRDEADRSGSGFGDLRLAFAKTLAREDGWWPDLVASVFWDTDSGESIDDRVVLGGGFHEVGGALRAVKREDPLAFVGSFSYETTVGAEESFRPGDAFGISLGTVLAASPETSLRVFFDADFLEEDEINGRRVGGTDTVIGSVSVGGSSVLGRGMFLDLEGIVGITDRGLDFAFVTSLPIRFSTPFF